MSIFLVAQAKTFFAAGFQNALELER